MVLLRLANTTVQDFTTYCSSAARDRRSTGLCEARGRLLTVFSGLLRVMSVRGSTLGTNDLPN